MRNMQCLHLLNSIAVLQRALLLLENCALMCKRDCSLLIECDTLACISMLSAFPRVLVHIAPS